MDDSKLGTKEKVDGKNQRTVLSQEEINKIIDTFNAGEAVDDFCVAVSYKEIEEKKLYFSAGQYFESKIDYSTLTPEQFHEKINQYKKELSEMFSKSHELENKLYDSLEKITYDL